ncbi:MAG TPA: NHLP bacteriocin export ABC transporter permease/ATPase subunit [Polyangiaceae bacterium]
MHQSETSFQSLAWLKRHLERSCTEVRVQGDEPLLLDDPSCAYATLSEHHQLFCVGYDRGRGVGRREHVATVEPGQLVFGLEPVAGTALILSGVTGSVVWRFPTALLFRLMVDAASRAAVAHFLDAWLRLLLATLPRAPKPRRLTALVAGESARARRTPPPGGPGAAEGFAVSARDALVWIAPERPLLGHGGIDLSGQRPQVESWPLTPDTWALCDDDWVTAHSTSELLEAAGSAAFAEPFCRFVISVVARRRESLSAARLLRDRSSKNAEADSIHAALHRLARVGSGQRLSSQVTGESPLARACNVIARHLGVPQPALDHRQGSDLGELEGVLSRATGVRTRSVLLERDWFVHQGGPLLAFLAAPEPPQPVALLPSARGYLMHDPATGAEKLIDAKLARALLPQAHQFYQPLPARASSLIDVMRVAARGAGRDVAFVVGLGTATGALALVVPWLTAVVFDRIIPGAERLLLRDLSVVLVAVYLSLGLFDVARGFVVVRVQARMDGTLEAAVWDRLLSLPLAFFRQFSAGDLAGRVAGFGRIRELFVGSIASALLGAVFSVWNLAVLLSIDVKLACAGLAWIALLASALLFAGYRSLERERTVAAIDGKIAGLLLQLFSGIGKLRTAAAENRAFSVWAKLFGERRDADLAAERTKIRAGLLPALIPTLASVTLFWLLVKAAPSTITTGEFLAFSAAFGTFLGAVQRALDAGLESLGIIPLYERARPILCEPAEAIRHVDGRTELRGAIELSHVCFRYTPGGPWVLDDVDLRIEAGEFVALVGSSGSGKSTLLRLLLGFESCCSGGVFYDEQALTSLDIRRVRQRIGAVLQNSRVSPGDIYGNIVGNTGLGLADAWRAARQAGLDADIAAMPMGMHTIVTQGGGTLSGGQRQRLLIARALATSPRILLFDEATSALDNVTQASVSASLEALRVTRVVVAHRLSTVRHADKIVVLERGRVVEVGRFDELMNQRGAFWQLARRQTL